MMRGLSCSLAAAVLMMCTSPVFAFEVYDSPLDDGNNPGVPRSIAPSSGETLNLYLNHGATLSDPNLACSGSGAGDELCAYKIKVLTSGDLTLGTFTPEPNQQVVFSADSQTLTSVGGDPIAGKVGVQRLGSLDVSAGPVGGSVTLDGTDTKFVGAGLTAIGVAGSILAVSVADPCAALGGDTDADGICDDGDGSATAGDNTCVGGATTNCDDNCRFISNPAQEDTSGVGLGPPPPDGIGDVCQCGDVNGDAKVDGLDSILSSRVSVGLPVGAAFSVPANCDVNGDNICNGLDAILISRASVDLANPASVTGKACPGYTNVCTVDVAGNCLP